MALLDKDLKPLDTVWYRQLQSKCGSIYSVENKAKATEDTDGCVISVNFTKIPANVHQLVVVASAYNHSFRSKKVMHLQFSPRCGAC